MNIGKISNLKIVSIAIVFIASLLITLLSPSNNTFKYQYSIGKPWQYDKLKASYEFPIYKDQAVIELERDSVKENSIKVYHISDKIKNDALNQWTEEYNNNISLNLIDINDDKLYHFILDRLEQYYDIGIISTSLKDSLDRNNDLELNLSKGKYSFEMVPRTRFYQPLEIFEIINDALKQNFKDIDAEKINLNKFININIEIDTLITNSLLKDSESKLSISSGSVQKDELIVDNGQIVDANIKNILDSYQKAEMSKSRTSKQAIIYGFGLFIIFIVLWGSFILVFINFNGIDQYSIKNVIFISVFMLLMIILTEMNFRYNLSTDYMIPYVILAMIVRMFFDHKLAFLSYIYTIIMSAIFVPESVGFITIQISAGAVALLSLRNLNNRAKIIKASLFVFLTYIILVMSLHMYQEGTIWGLLVDDILHLALNTIFIIFSFFFVYVFEKMFGYISNFTLVELSDVSNPILSKLSEEAPGTFQHSMQVATLATEAARKVGANVYLIRAGALYHDIGKIKNPMYFTENQGLYNPHDAISYEESAKIIIRHVIDGISIAHKYNLPNQIIDFIRTHHGRSYTKYFYNMYSNEHIGEEIDKEPFTYPGPNPFNKETGILMLADSVEASSRSLKEHTEEGIKKLIDKIIDDIVFNGLLNDTNLTFSDIKTIKQVFYEKIKIMYHSRISYPENKNEDKK